MTACGPFEAAPRLAAAVSGGPDSLALCLLARDWAREKGGSVTALIVDHRLRQGSGAEARTVRDGLAALGVAAEILTRPDAPPESALQAEARTARHALLEHWCGAKGVLHLLLAHHENDQAETVLIRLAHRSGPGGLAGMALVSESRQVRRLRPLLGIPRDRLRATLEASGTGWIEDPSNTDPAFERVRVRAALADALADGLTAARVAGSACDFGRRRIETEAATAALLARAVMLDPAGHAWLDPHAFRSASAETAEAGLARLLTTVSGAPYTPRSEKIARLCEMIVSGALGGGRTLHGCRLVPRKQGILAIRELRHVAGFFPLSPGETVLWDGRFLVETSSDAPKGLAIGALGCVDWRATDSAPPARDADAIPRIARPVLPAVTRRGGLWHVPHLGLQAGRSSGDNAPSIRFAPRNPLTTAGFKVVLPAV